MADPSDPSAQLDPATRKLLAETMVGEAGGEGPRGMQAVMNVALNRARQSGQSLSDVLNTQGAFTSMGPLGQRSVLDQLTDAQLAKAYGVIDKPDPTLWMDPNTVYFYNPTLQGQEHAKDPKDYPAQPGFAQGAPAYRIGQQAFYRGQYKGGAPGAGAPAPPATLDQALTQLVGGLVPSPQEQKQIAADEAEMGPLHKQEQEALDARMEFDKAQVKRYDDLQTHVDRVYDQFSASMKSVTDALPDEKKMEQEALAGVSNRPNDPTRVLGEWLPMIAILGGAFTRAGALGSLKAAGAAMQAAKTNDQTALTQAHQLWQDQTQQLLNKVSFLHDQLGAIIEKNKGDSNALLQEAGLMGDIYNIPVLKMANATGDINAIMTARAAMGKSGLEVASILKQSAAEDRQTAMLKMQEARLDAYMKGQQPGLTPDATDVQSDLMLDTGKLTYMGMGAKADREAVLNNLAPRAAKRWGVGPDQVAQISLALQGDVHAGQQALVQLGKQKQQLLAYVGGPDPTNKTSGKGAEEIAAQIEKEIGPGAGTTGAEFWNKYQQWARRKFENAPVDVIELRNLILDLQQESAKIMSGSQGSVRAVSDSMQKEMEDMISADMTPAGIEGALDAMRKGWKARIDGYDNAYALTEKAVANAPNNAAVMAGLQPPSEASASTSTTAPTAAPILPGGTPKDPLGLGF